MGTQTAEQAEQSLFNFFGDRSPACTEELGGSVCRVTFVPEVGGTQTRTCYLRCATWVEIDQTNFPTNGLLPAVGAEVWGG